LLGSLFDNRVKLAPFGFADYGKIERVDPLPGEADSDEIASAGLGVKVEAYERLFAKVDFGYVIQGAGETGDDESRWHFRLSYRF
ncbi:MAG: hypothetical protein C0614_04770, partial [Desulfuromonas sp.]